MPAKRYPSLLWSTLKSWHKDHVNWLAAALAYYTIFSFIPILIILVNLLSNTFGQSALRGDVSYYLGLYLNASTAEWIESLLVNAYQPQGSITGTLMTTVLLIFGASGFLFHLKQAFHQIWGIKRNSNNPIFYQFYERVISLILIISLSIVFILSLTLSAALASFAAQLSALLPVQDITIFQAIEHLLSFAIITTILAFLFKVLPDKYITWNAAFRGAMVSSLLFILGKVIMGYYLSYSNIVSAYGAANSLVALLLWIYYSAHILLFGAEFTKVYTQKYEQ